MTPISGLHIPRYFSINLSTKDGFRYAILRLVLIYLTIVFIILDPTSAFVMVVFPFVWLFTAVNYWTDCIDHVGLLEGSDELTQSRNVRMPHPLRWILFPRNDSYHLVHHLFPAVPIHHFDTCHKMLMKNGSYRNLHIAKKRLVSKDVQGPVI